MCNKKEVPNCSFTYCIPSIAIQMRCTKNIVTVIDYKCSQEKSSKTDDQICNFIKQVINYGSARFNKILEIYESMKKNNNLDNIILVEVNFFYMVFQYSRGGSETNEIQSKGDSYWLGQ